MEVSTEQIHEHAWKYFELHANQRMTVFNFFLIVSGLVLAGLAAALQGSGQLALVGVVLGLLLALVSFVFWKLDQRASFFIKRAETALAFLERTLPEPQCQLFLTEPRAADAAMAGAGRWNRQWTYGQSFRLVFRVMGSLGVGGALLSMLRYGGWFAP